MYGDVPLAREITRQAPTPLIDLYRQWSEEFYFAGFMHPNPEIVVEFRRWLKEREDEPLEDAPLEDYEHEFLEEFRRQEGIQ